MSKYLIEVDAAEVDDRADELVQRMVDEGSIQLVSPSLDLDVKILGKVTAEDCPGDQHIVAIELFDSMAAQTFGDLTPKAQTNIYDRMTEVTSLVMRTASLTDTPATDLDVLLARVASMRAMLDNLRSAVVAARGI